MPDFSKMNGEKRSAAEVESHPAKRQAVEGVITNGVMPSNGVNGGGVARGGQGMVIVSQSGGAQQPMQGQLVKSSTGQLFLKTTSSSGGAVLVPAGQQTQQGQVLMQPGPQKLLLVNQGGRQVVVGEVELPAWVPWGRSGRGDDLPEIKLSGKWLGNLRVVSQSRSHVGLG